MYLVRSAGIKGLGVFATKLITRGTRIFSEKPILGIRYDQGPGDVYQTFRRLDAGDRAKVLELSAAATTKLAMMRWLHVLWYTARSAVLPWPRHLREHKTLLNIFRSNSFSLNNGSKFAQGIFPQIARLNHECVPNAQANFNDETGSLNVHALRDIAPDQEITLSYLDDAGDMLQAERQDSLDPYGFSCACNICQGGHPAARESEKRRETINKTALSVAQESDQSGKESNRARELEALMDIIALMQQEGLVGRELSARYFAAAEWYKELGDLTNAVGCAERGREIDGYTLGTDHKAYREDGDKINEYKILHGEHIPTLQPHAAYA